MIDPNTPPERFLRRWSQRKLAATAAKQSRSDAPAFTDRVEALVPAAAESVSQPSAQPADVPVPTPEPDAVGRPPELPPLESLTFDSDFTAFFRAGVDEVTKRSALKKLFADKRFNVMDGLDTYIADYSLPDPIDSEIVRQMVSARYIFDPPQTRLNEQGVIEDVPRVAVIDAKQSNAEGNSVIEAASVEMADTMAPGSTVEDTPVRSSSDLATDATVAANGPEQATTDEAAAIHAERVGAHANAIGAGATHAGATQTGTTYNGTTQNSTIPAQPR